MPDPTVLLVLGAVAFGAFLRAWEARGLARGNLALLALSLALVGSYFVLGAVVELDQVDDDDKRTEP